jgi:hypothetical protein
MQNRDSEVVMLQRGIAALVLAAMVFYFRLGWNSVTVAEELGLHAPAIRMLTYRIRHLADGQKVPWRRPKPVKSWSNFEIGKLKFLLANGMTADQCAVELNLAVATVLSMCKEHFPKFAYTGRKRKRKWSPERVKELRRLLTGGLSARDCSRKFRCSVNSIRYVRSKLLPGLEIPEKRRFNGRRRRKHFRCQI